MQYLDLYLSNQEVGVDRYKYLLICEQTNSEPEEDKIPPEYSDFPTFVHKAFEIYNMLSDNYSGGMSSIYSGKDYSPLHTFFKLFSVDENEQLYCLRVIYHLDSRARQKAIKEAKAAAKKAKAK